MDFDTNLFELNTIITDDEGTLTRKICLYQRHRKSGKYVNIDGQVHVGVGLQSMDLELNTIITGH